MSDAEREFIADLQRLAGVLVGATVYLQVTMKPGTLEHRKAALAAEKALQLDDLINNRLNAAERDQDQAGGYDLAALATAAPAAVEE